MGDRALIVTEISDYAGGNMQEIFDTCQPRPEVLSGELREEIFAARLKDVIDGTADPIYQDPATFFDNTYPTEGLKSLLGQALGRATGVRPANSAIIRLETSFGGGKTHNLIALYHVARGYPAPFVSGEIVPEEGSLQVVGVVGSDLDPSTGLNHDGLRTYTLWGELAFQLGQADGYELARESESTKAAPGTGFLEDLIGDRPTIILLDEIARHLRAAKAVPTATRKSDLAEQVVAFLMSLLEFAASKERTVVVLTLAEATDAFSQETASIRLQLTEARSVSARQEQVITSAAETEIAAIVTHRLFKAIDKTAAGNTAGAYGSYLKRLMDQGADLPTRAGRAGYGQEIEANYPFHPELLNTLNRKTSTIPNFQKTRGALRLLAMVIRQLWEARPPHTCLIHPYHLDLSVEGIANDLTSRLERPRFKQVIEADIVSPQAGSQAHAQIVDAPWLDAGKPPYASRAATTVFLHSLSQGIATGVNPADLTVAALQPDDDPAMIAKATEYLADHCWFFEWDGHRYRFKTEPSLNKIIHDEMGVVRKVKAKGELDRRIRQVWKAGYLKPVFFPSEARDVDDDADKPKLVVIHYDAAASGADQPQPPDLVRKIADHAGSLEGYRTYRNNLLFLVADTDQVTNMVAVAQKYLAIERITGDAERMGEFALEQRNKLKKMGEAAELEVRVAITKAYRYLYYPSADAPQSHSNLVREVLPAQDQGEVDQDQSNVVLRMLKLLDKVLTGDDKRLAAAYVKAKAWDSGQQSLSTEELRKAFARRMSLRILLDLNQLKNTIRDGIKNGTWVYYDTAAETGYGTVSPPPAVQISDDVLLYTPEEARKAGIPIKGETPPGDEREPELTCPVCDNLVDECTCAVGGGDEEAPRRFHAEGAPAQAFQSILDQCQDHDIPAIGTLLVSVSGTDRVGADGARLMGLAIPQLGKGHYRVEQTFNAEFGTDESISLTFAGSWDRYKRLKQVTDSFGQEADKLLVTTTLRADFALGLPVESDQFLTIRDVFTTLGFGRMALDAEPYQETDA